jgi:hypothetical protein
MKKFDFKPIADALNSNQTVLILLPQNPNLDQVASGLAIYLALKKTGKNTTITCPTGMTVGFNHLVGVNKISTSIGGKNLIISFDYIEDSIEKVSYNIEGQKFNLVIEPKPNFPPFDPNKVQYTHSGATANLIFAIGGQKPESFTTLYQKERRLFTQKTLINIDSRPGNTQFGQINLTDPTASSCSEITVALLQGLGVKMNPDIANNLLMGLTSATNNFQNPKITGDTFEAAAICMDYGARSRPGSRFPQATPPLKSTQKPLASPLASQPTPFQPLQPSTPPQPQTPLRTIHSQPTPQNYPPSQPQPKTKKRQSTPKRKTFPKRGKKFKNQPSADWLKPKIYKSSTKT